MAEKPGSPAPTDEELQRLVMPTILELQKVLVERFRRPTTMRPGDELAVVSVTSCNQQSCN